MKRAYIISPYRNADPVKHEANKAYAIRAMHCAWAAGYAPFAAHIFYAASGALDDNDAKERDFGFRSGHAFLLICDKALVFLDAGVSEGMRIDALQAAAARIPLEYVSLSGSVFTSGAIHNLKLPHEHMPCAVCQEEKKGTSSWVK